MEPQQDPGFNNPEKIRKIVEESGNLLLQQALEKELTIKEMQGKSASGLFYTITDKKPDLPASEFKAMTQGASPSGIFS